MTDGFTLTRSSAAPAHAVYDAWTTPAQFAAWFGGAASEVDPPSDSR